MTPDESVPQLPGAGADGQPGPHCGAPLEPDPRDRDWRWGVLHAIAFFVFLGLWTWKLLESYPVPEGISAALTVEMHFVAAKSLHACGYGFLTLLAVTLPIPHRWRWALVCFLALHGVGTEIGQTYVPNRHGSRLDVAIDWCGVAAAVLVWRVWAWRFNEPDA